MVQLDYGALILAAQMRRWTKQAKATSRHSIEGEAKRLQGPVAPNSIYPVRPVRPVRNRPNAAIKNWLNESIAGGWRVGVMLESDRPGTFTLAYARLLRAHQRF